MTIVLTKKFLDTLSLNLIKVQNDVGLNRSATEGEIGTKIITKNILIL